MKIAMLGTGAYGLALSVSLSRNNNNNNITMWTENASLVEEFNKTHRLDKIFEGYSIPSSISLTTSYEEALDNADIIFIGCAAKYVGSVCRDIKPFYKNGTPICIASKGIEDSTRSFLSDLVQNTLETDNVAVLSGPTFAIDIMNNDPIALTLAGTNEFTINAIQGTLACDTLKLRTTDDLIGVQICGSVKNVIAIASGMVKGLGYSESTLAFLINESLLEIRTLISELGGDKKTILSYAGVGDLLLTCTSTKSRNYSFGYTIGSTKDKEKISEFLNTHTVEGYYALSSIHKLAEENGINLPIINVIYNIIVNGEDPVTLTKFLVEQVYNTSLDLKRYAYSVEPSGEEYYYYYSIEDMGIDYDSFIKSLHNGVQRTNIKKAGN